MNWICFILFLGVVVGDWKQLFSFEKMYYLEQMHSMDYNQGSYYFLIQYDADHHVFFSRQDIGEKPVSYYFHEYGRLGSLTVKAITYKRIYLMWQGSEDLRFTESRNDGKDFEKIQKPRSNNLDDGKKRTMPSLYATSGQRLYTFYLKENVIHFVTRPWGSSIWGSEIPIENPICGSKFVENEAIAEFNSGVIYGYICRENNTLILLYSDNRVEFTTYSYKLDFKPIRGVKLSSLGTLFVLVPSEKEAVVLKIDNYFKMEKYFSFPISGGPVNFGMKIWDLDKQGYSLIIHIFCPPSENQIYTVSMTNPKNFEKINPLTSSPDSVYVHRGNVLSTAIEGKYLFAWEYEPDS